MEFIAHRINTIEELISVPYECGVELDLRDDLNNKIYISHNPFENGEYFEDYLKRYKNGTMILNVKSERIELPILKLLEKNNIDDYFFLDSSFPMIYQLNQCGNTNIALRYSEYEGMDTIRNMRGKAKWIWVDCFTKNPLTRVVYDEMKELGYKICFVSPELQGREEDLLAYKHELTNSGIELDAICSKIRNYDKWMKS